MGEGKSGADASFLDGAGVHLVFDATFGRMGTLEGDDMVSPIKFLAEQAFF